MISLKILTEILEGKISKNYTNWKTRYFFLALLISSDHLIISYLKTKIFTKVLLCLQRIKPTVVFLE